MPLNTDVTNPPSKSDIKVKDGGPGGGRNRIVDVLVSWDSRILNYLGHTPKGDYCSKRGTGTVHWHLQKCLPRGKHFYVKLKRKKNKKNKVTYVVACSLDPETGEVSRPSAPPVPFP